jgi:hypothetical protein
MDPDNATNVTPMPDKANAMARQAFLGQPSQCVSVGSHVLHGQASHYPLFGK